ncbi:MAG: hypothetical protein JWP82_2790, partial [Humibacillus sp.]|nr:hypothetical protein [Humibacillus sp.]
GYAAAAAVGLALGVLIGRSGA